MNDDEKGKRLTANGSYVDRKLNETKLNSQEMFYAMAYSSAEKAVNKTADEKNEDKQNEDKQKDKQAAK